MPTAPGEWDPPESWTPCENRADPASWDDPEIVDEPYDDAAGEP